MFVSKGRSKLKADNFIAISADCLDNVGSEIFHNYPEAYYGDSYTFLHVDVRTSEKTYICASTACHGESCTFLRVNDVHTKQEAILRVSTAC
jgi:hypothetical protein